jgi:hemerythrin-like domain-containing protein
MILRSINVLQSMAESGEHIDPADIATLLRFLRTFGDHHHHLKEEGVLFPELMKTSPAEEAPVRHLLFEHNQERSLVEGVEDALRTKKGADFLAAANRLASRIRNHIQKEDDILFPIIEGLITTDQDDRVSAQFEKLQPDTELLSDLRFLEKKYLRKTVN